MGKHTDILNSCVLEFDPGTSSLSNMLIDTETKGLLRYTPLIGLLVKYLLKDFPSLVEQFR